jgi:hypothetical protein
MPQAQVTVYHKETGDAVQMHSVDAAEALRTGEYVTTPPKGSTAAKKAAEEAAAQTPPPASPSPDSAETGAAEHARGRRSSG